MNKKSLSVFILAGLILGILAGYAAHSLLPDGSERVAVAGDFHLLADVFIRMIKMIIAPLVFAGIVSGMQGMDSPREIGRLGGKAMLWFLVASIFSLLLGLTLADFFAVGHGVPLPQGTTVPDTGAGALNLKTFITHLVPQSVVAAMSQNDIIAIVLFSLFFGFALAAIQKAEPCAGVLGQSIEGILKVMLQLTHYVMWFAPVGVFGATAAAITEHGLSVISVYGEFIAAAYTGLTMLALVMLSVGYALLKKDLFRLLREMKAPMLIAFSTSSSEAAFPKMVEQLTRFGIPRRLTTLILPLGYSFNADGAMMYQAFATVFLLQAYNIEVTFMQQIAMLLVMLVASKGAAGVPRASLVVVASTLPMFGIPAEGIAILLATDTFIDMGRTLVNLIGNGIATAVIARSEEKKASRQSAAGSSPQVSSQGKIKTLSGR